MSKNEEGLKLKYFILKPESKHRNDEYARASRKAMREYAHHLHVSETNRKLAKDLYAWAEKEYDSEIERFGS